MPIIHWQSHGHQPVIMLPSLIRLVVPSDPVSAEAPLAPERQVTQTAPHNPALASGHPSHPALLAGCTVTQRATTMLPQMTGSLECSCCFLSRPLSALASGCPLEFSDSDMHVRALILHEFCLPYNNIPTPRATEANPQGPSSLTSVHRPFSARYHIRRANGFKQYSSSRNDGAILSELGSTSYAVQSLRYGHLYELSLVYKACFRALAKPSFGPSGSRDWLVLLSTKTKPCSVAHRDFEKYCGGKWYLEISFVVLGV
jgi:hypothetical protein